MPMDCRRWTTGMHPTILVLLVGVAVPIHAQSGSSVSAVVSPPGRYGGLYASANREPLHPAPLCKLPTGAITPRGWLKTQLNLMKSGMVGRLEELSPWCRFEGSAWASATGEGSHGWEELPYWLRGFTSLAFVLKDPALQRSALKWLDGILSSQQPDGYFGPRENLQHMDLWPNMVALYALRTLHEATGDERVLSFMLRYFRWQMNVPRERFIPASWQHVRGGDNLDSILWLYNRTGEKWLLDLARKTHEATAPWERGIASFHGVNFAQGFREPGQFFQVSRDRRHLEATWKNYAEMRRLYGQVPGGMYGADENARPGYTGPRQGTETCAFVEIMYSFEELTRITGNPVWADRCEDVALNSFPSSLTPDMRALHYLTCPNQVVLDRANKAPMIQNVGDMFSYNPYEQYRCCQHNVAFGWPYYAEHLWMATRDGGVAAVLYAPCVVRARVATGIEASVTVDTEYPFGDKVTVSVSVPRTARFPIYLRVPGWCSAPELQAGRGQSKAYRGTAGRWLRVERTWRSGDNVTLRLPMSIRVTRWKENRNTVSVHRGPLTYSLRIVEDWRRYDTGRSWPGFEVWPASPWNYGLVLDPNKPERSIRLVATQSVRAGSQPFDWQAAPIQLRARARRIPNWGLDPNNLIQEVVPGPVRSDEPTEDVVLIPMGCARLRLTAFPLIGTGPGAREWPEAQEGTSASWVNPSDTLAALTDGILPASSSDTSIPRFTWWDRQGTVEWVQQTFRTARRISGCDVYWFDDEPVGGRCRLPQSWRVLWLDGTTWREVEPVTAYETFGDRFSQVRFREVSTKALRIEVQLREGFSGGILEWRVLP